MLQALHVSHKAVLLLPKLVSIAAVVELPSSMQYRLKASSLASSIQCHLRNDIVLHYITLHHHYRLHSKCSTVLLFSSDCWTVLTTECESSDSM